MKKSIKVQRKIEGIINRFRAFSLLIHSSLVAFRFAEFGYKSRLEAPAKLIQPYLASVGNNVHICNNFWLNANDGRNDGNPTLRIGDRTYIGRMVQINAWQEVVIGSDVLIADRVLILDADHQIDDIKIPIRLQGDDFFGAVYLNDGCFIGAGSVIMPGVTIGKNAVVGANSVVTKNVPNFAVVAGVPAKIIKTLDKPKDLRC